MRKPLTILALCVPLVMSPPALAQASPVVPRAGDRLWGMWFGAAFNSPIDSFWGGTTPGRSFALVGLRAYYVVETLGPVAIAFTADLIPIAIVNNNPRWRWRELVGGGEVFEYKEITDSGLVYGTGLSPGGLHFSLPAWGPVRVYASGAVGGLWFTREVPGPYARSFNYTVEFGGGVDVAVGAAHVVVVGFKFHHLSNMNAASSNPGLDGTVFSLGLMRRRSAMR